MGALGSLGSMMRSCFAAGTPLLTPEGSKQIDQLRPGDWVLAAPEDDPEAPPEPRRVEEVFQNYAPLMELLVGGRTIRTTAEHPFWVRGRRWTPAHQLMAGDHLKSHDGRWEVLNGVAGNFGAAPVYNLRVAEYHTYFVGAGDWGFSVWAHNVLDCVLLGRNLDKVGETSALGQAAHIVPTGAFRGRSAQVQKAIQDAQKALTSAGIDINSAQNGFRAAVGHSGTHTNAFLLDLGEQMTSAMASGKVAETLDAIKHSSRRACGY